MADNELETLVTLAKSEPTAKSRDEWYATLRRAFHLEPG